MPFDGSKFDEATVLLVNAKAFLEAGWCRYKQGVAADGSCVEPDSQDAVAWCAYGALVRAGLRNGDTKHPAVKRLVSAMGDPVALFNNRQISVAPVLDAFDRAIITP